MNHPTPTPTLSYWADKRDVPDSKFGKSAKPANCTCTLRFSCRVCFEAIGPTK